MYRCVTTVGVSLLFVYGLAHGQTAAQATPADGSDTPPQLKSAPILVPPPLKALTPGIGTDRDAVYLRADRLEGESEKAVEATGKVELRTRRQTVLADWLHYDLSTEEVWAKGNVVIRRGTDTITGPEARFKRTDETGFVTQPDFHIGENSSRGVGKELQFLGENKYQITDMRYTTCVAGNDDWYLTSDEVDVDRSRLVGTAHNASIIFKGTTILSTPSLDFPLSNDRKSGFLTPVFGSTNSRGFEMSMPYYFNLAPNYDATLTPRLMTKRGLQLIGQARYLFPDAVGEVDAEYLPDSVTGTNRYLLAWKHNQNFAAIPGLAGFVNVEKVSDSAYFTDLSDRLVVTSQTVLPRDVGFTYNKGPFSFLTQVQTFQTLQDPANPIVPPYFREPQLLMTMSPVSWNGLDFEATGEFVRFRQPTLVTGDRTMLYPTVTWSQRGNYWFFTARAGLSMTHYDLNQSTPPDTSLVDLNMNRVLPITSIDTGLVFERDTNWFGRAFTQTLEPRAYFVYIPYRNQSQIPAFDTAIDDFNFSQLFTENRYLGIDRIGDANQLTLAASTRFLDPQTGDEKMRFAIGQRYYFESQQVTLTEPPRTGNTSDVLLAGEARLSDVWSASGALDYDLAHPQVERLDSGIRWQPAPGSVLNASYRYIRQQVDSSGTVTQPELKQIDFSGQWPFKDNWSVIGRWNYSIVDKTTLEGVIGVEYNGGCWAFRIVAQRLTTATDTVTKSVFAQFELNGLARFGTNPIDVLKRSVPGYLTVTDPTLHPTGPAANDYFPNF
jgi:LPS-assembly protein